MKKQFANILCFDMGSANNIGALCDFLPQFKRNKSDTFVLLDNDKTGNDAKIIAERQFSVFQTAKKDIEAMTLIEQYSEPFRQRIKSSYSTLLKHINDGKIIEGDGSKSIKNCLLTKFIGQQNQKDQILNPITNNNEEASNVFKIFWVEYLKQHPEIVKDCYSGLIQLLKDHLC